MALASVVARAILEQEDPSEGDLEPLRQSIIDWIGSLDLGDELLPDESRDLHRPVGELDPQSAAQGTWKLERLAVLAWVLGCYELPPYDELVDPGPLLEAVGFLNPPAARELLDFPTVRAGQELTEQRDMLEAVQWRLSEFVRRPERIDFQQGALGAVPQPLNIAGLRLVDGDLAVGARTISEVTAVDTIMALVLAVEERQRAIRWVLGGERE
jgi:hypothetical protein